MYGGINEIAINDWIRQILRRVVKAKEMRDDARTQGLACRTAEVEEVEARGGRMRWWRVAEREREVEGEG